jgi:segregation and condensation protein A
MAERTVPWWRKALNYALDGIRSGFGFFSRPTKPTSVEGPRFQEEIEDSLEEENLLSKAKPRSEMLTDDAKPGPVAATEEPVESLAAGFETMPDPVSDTIYIPLAMADESVEDNVGGIEELAKQETWEDDSTLTQQVPSPEAGATEFSETREPVVAVQPAPQSPGPDPDPPPAPIEDPNPEPKPEPIRDPNPNPDPEPEPDPESNPEPIIDPPVDAPSTFQAEDTASASAPEIAPIEEAVADAMMHAGPTSPLEQLPSQPQEATASTDSRDVVDGLAPDAIPTFELPVAYNSAQEAERFSEPAAETQPVDMPLAVEVPPTEVAEELPPQVEAIPGQEMAVTELRSEPGPAPVDVQLSESMPEPAAPASPAAEMPTQLDPVAPAVAEAVAETEPARGPEQPHAAEDAPSAQPVPPEVDSKAVARLAARQKRLDEADEQSPFSVIVAQVYDGPLDLLLDLIRKQDIDIYDIPIAKITSQFLAYVNQLKASDVDVAGEFIYTASLLIHIKSKMLLPRAPVGPEDTPEDPRRELVERLLEHERFKNAAQMLQQKQLLEAASWTNPGAQEFKDDESVEPEIAADTVDLVRIFRDILERARTRPVIDVTEDQVTVGQMIQFLSRRLTMEDKPVALRRLLAHTRSERALIAMFLALLELVRLQAILLRQDRQFSEIFIKKNTGFDSVMNEGLVNARDDWK